MTPAVRAACQWIEHIRSQTKHDTFGRVKKQALSHGLDDYIRVGTYWRGNVMGRSVIRKPS